MDLRELKYYNSRDNSEYYRVYDKNGKFLRTIDRCEEKSLKDEFLYGVTCFVINENKEVLMEVRANTELTPGKVDLVSGHVDGDETPSQAMIRELREEVGIKNIDNTQIRKVSELPKPLFFESRGEIRRFFINFYCLKTKKHHFTIQPEEVEALKWIPMEQAFEMIRLGKTKFPKQSERVNYNKIFENVRKIVLEINPQEKKVIGE